ncbi:unnamed protein product [Brassicogethes aeneus]|uniref:Sarcolemmal membrane-associated protein n=1 Tax=Brassicogethes aeneus TaxID=1431903 RepID=A0A9P0FQB0_BRAAE|nr:unnamed protein product [Brassicogethes aeneus]
MWSFSLGMVPLDDLYKLNQVIQEAKQREQCLETKLAALQRIVDSTRRSADESWQAYVGEERLLSRVSVLESQLHQASKNFGEDRIREELSKVQEHNEAYQIAAKEALEKLHAERLEAVSMATEQERARITAEQEALLAKEQLAQAQDGIRGERFDLEKVKHCLRFSVFQEVAQKLTEEQKAASEERRLLEEKLQELEVKFEEETVKYYKLLQMNTYFQDGDDLDKSRIIYNDVKTKEELLLAENEEKNEEIKSNGVQNHITLSVRPVKEDDDSQREKEDRPEDERASADVSSSDVTMRDEDDEKSEVREPLKQVHFNLPEDKDENSSFDGDDTANRSQTSEMSNDTVVTAACTDLDDERAIGDHREKSDYVDSKTLKYQYQSQQNELRKRIEVLETLGNVSKAKMAEMDRELSEERAGGRKRSEENDGLRKELAEFKHRLKESCNEGQQLRDKIEALTLRLHEKMERVQELDKEHNEAHTEKSDSCKVVSIQQLVNVEEELVLLKERFALTSEEKLKLQHDLLNLTQQYNVVCNRSYNKHFFYVAPLVIMVLYLLVSAMIS